MISIKMTINTLIASTLLMVIPAFGDVVTSTERVNDTFTADSLTLPAPIKSWDDALPLGNGLLGGLLWGEGRELRLSLDRGGLWDERGNADVYSPNRTYATLLESVGKKDNATWKKYFNDTYFHSKWTKIPGARLVITLPDGTTVDSFHLDFPRATAEVKTSTDPVTVFFSATDPVALARVPAGSTFDLIRPAAINSLGYPAAGFTRTDHGIGFSQKTAEDLQYAFTVEWKTDGKDTLLAISSATNAQGGDPLESASKNATQALDKGWEEMHAAHLKWWNDFYHTSSVTIPEPRLQTQYDLDKYFYGSASRADSPPMPLQGIWTADDGKLPPWKGDYHNDLNTQMTYVAWQAAGLTDSGMSYINYYVDCLPEFRKYGKQFFGLDTAMIPGVTTLRGQAMGGWPQYAMSLTDGLWNTHAFYEYWKTSQDSAFLAKTAYPFLSEITTSVLALTDEKDGKLYLKTSSSPEWGEGSMSSYLTPNSNYDQALLTWSLNSLKEMAQALGKSDDVKKWDTFLAKMPPLQFSPTTHALLVAQGMDFSHSHRHFSHAIAIYPLGSLNVDQGPEQSDEVRASVRQIIDKGPTAWTGFSYNWAACLAARAGFPDDAARLLTDFERAFVTRNGFHANGDQTKSGLSHFTYRPFTLEANFLFMAGIQEMYLQSWGDKIRIFPAVPDSWKDCAFTDLCAEGGFKVSATRENGRTTHVEIMASTDTTLRLHDPFSGSTFESNIPHASEGDLFSFSLKAGDTLKLQSTAR